MHFAARIYFFSLFSFQIIFFVCDFFFFKLLFRHAHQFRCQHVCSTWFQSDSRKSNSLPLSHQPLLFIVHLAHCVHYTACAMNAVKLAFCLSLFAFIFLCFVRISVTRSISSTSCKHHKMSWQDFSVRNGQLQYSYRETNSLEPFKYISLKNIKVQIIILFETKSLSISNNLQK